MKIAYHLVGMVRTFEFCRFNIQSTVKALSEQLGVDEVVVFCTFWDYTNTAGFIRSNGKLYDYKELPKFDVTPIDKDEITRFCKELESAKVKVDLQFLSFDTQRPPHSSFLYVIYESYKQRLRYELDTNVFFSRVVLTRPDVALYQKPHDTSRIPKLIQTIATINTNLNIINDEIVEPTRFREVKNFRYWFNLDQFTKQRQNPHENIQFTHMSIVKDFFFYGNRREMNILMRAHPFAMDSHCLERAHTFLAAYLNLYGIIMSDQLEGDLRPMLIKRIFDTDENKFCDDFETTFTRENSCIENIHTRDELMSQREYINDQLFRKRKEQHENLRK